MIDQGYKYHSIAREQDKAKMNILSPAMLFSFHCIQFGLQMGVILLIVHNSLLSSENYEIENKPSQMLHAIYIL